MEYLMCDDKEEIITLYSNLVMVQESVSNSAIIGAVGECAVDGALQDERDITIYYYRSNMLDDLGKGVPVVLNVSNSNQFLKCTFQQDKAVLSLGCFEKEKLNLIYKNDPLVWPFVFYLTHTKDDCRHFESAECRGWFIRTQSELVYMDKDADKNLEDKSFLLISSPNTSRSEG
ncbi:hypothetical protein Baya_14042 [Bagarius yarrelli]|uniref:Interleukin-1 n=1 Tax=Bagarius yarrelli TaxID=175774 RepID=A0A556V7G8_BAGYA|nr:hypothetical protein Baya_14042 [Bagarius yarrelli]